MYDRILLPTDGGAPAEQALENALDLAEQYDAELHLLNVVDTTVFAGEVETGPVVEQFEQTGTTTVETLVEAVRERGHDRVVGDVVHGRPHTGILSYVEKNDIDLIVMGTRGRTGLDRYLLGSVTEKVVRLSDVPVLTVRHKSE
ncbi:universal stress protein [Natronococcus pandeyae]|uniref:Universal stress protein n=1 Tax=Natronococcus pandeyae TaxID=2055836 RepID=A0A8J8PZT3_9EURY|nr:universal stress protein [Natronococcus pandeyae]TYL36677.1 universal stress protein [Natronococcus pandeyae]